MNPRKKLLWLTLCLFFVRGGSRAVHAESVFAVASHSNSKIKAYLINGDEINYQATIKDTESFGMGATGFCVWPQKQRMFVTYEGESVISWASTKTLDQKGRLEKEPSKRTHAVSFENLKQIREGGFRIYAAGPGPSNKFCDIHPSISSFTIVDIALGFTQHFSDLTLRKSRIFPQLAKITGYQPVFHTVLCFCCHATNLSSTGLDTICVSC